MPKYDPIFDRLIKNFEPILKGDWRGSIKRSKWMQIALQMALNQGWLDFGDVFRGDRRKPLRNIWYKYCVYKHIPFVTIEKHKKNYNLNYSLETCEHIIGRDTSKNTFTIDEIKYIREQVYFVLNLDEGKKNKAQFSMGRTFGAITNIAYDEARQIADFVIKTWRDVNYMPVLTKNQSKPREKDYEEIDGHCYAVLYRETEGAPTEPCVFCGKNHQHGKGDGHRVGHCSWDDGVKLDTWVVLGETSAGKEIKVCSADGYIIRTRNKKIVQQNEDLSRLGGKTMIKIFKDGKHLAIQTNAINENDFTVNFAIALQDFMTGSQYEGNHEIATLLKGYTEICCKLRGYKAEVMEQRLLTVGAIYPASDNCVTVAENGSVQLTESVS